MFEGFVLQRLENGDQTASRALLLWIQALATLNEFVCLKEMETVEFTHHSSAFVIGNVCDQRPGLSAPFAAVGH